MRGLIGELRVLLADNDPRWQRFGLKLPARIARPDQVKQVNLTPLGKGKVQVEWSQAPRAERFRSLFTDEYGDLALGELVGMLTLPQQQISPFSMMQHADRAVRLLTPVPYSILAGEDFVGSSGPIQPGASHLDPKADRYRTTQGVLGVEQYNRQASAFTPTACTDRFRFQCETWVKYNAGTPLADELYRAEQAHSRTLAGKGTG